MNKPSKTDWTKVQAEAVAEASIPYDAGTDLYDPNDEASVREFWSTAKIVRPGRPRAAVKRPTLNMRVDADVLEHLRRSGKGWQTRVNKVLRDAVKNGVL